jgi:hypothetical protein
MELASMLAGERFGDRPPSVCPVIGALLRAYNDNVDKPRRPDLYRYAADAVDTRRDHAVTHRRAEAAIKWARKRRELGAGSHKKIKKLPVPPTPEAGRDQIAFYVLGSLERRGQRRGRWTEESHEAMLALLDWLISIGRERTLEPFGPMPEPELEPLLNQPEIEEAAFALLIGEDPVFAESALDSLIGQLLEHDPEPVEYGGGGQQVLVAERVQCVAELRLGARTTVLDEGAAAFGEGREHDAPVATGPDPLHQPGGAEALTHLGHARGTEVGGVGQIAERELALVTEPEQQAVLRVGELAGAVGLAPAHPSQRGNRSLERSRNLLGGVALLALAYHVAKSR